MKGITKILMLFGLALISQTVSAQRVALKTNAIDWLTMSPNIAVETRLNSRLTLDIGVVINPFDFQVAEIRTSNLRFQPELRYWFNRPMARHFVGFTMLGCAYDIQIKDRVYQGDLFAAGITYGYSFVLSRNWNMEVTVGAGIGKLKSYNHNEYDDKPDNPTYDKWIPVPVRLGLSFSYIFN